MLITSSAELLASKRLQEDGCTLWYDEAHVTHPKLHDEFLRPLLECRGRSGAGLRVRSPRALLHSLRAVKSTAEIQLMKEAGRITAQFDFECRAGGANFLAYPPVVAGGNRANTLHYAALYQAVLDVQRSCVELCTPGAARRYCPHHVGHYLGMDVHDTPEVSRTRSLQPGMVITIEPGLYIPEDDLSAPQRYRGLGVRIEDNVLITEEGGPLVLSADTPKEIDDIERVCAGGD
ncbi:UNVERIFIED_CONTAM: hypothetical protein FKN15_001744 [Acipenser sinensis]